VAELIDFGLLRQELRERYPATFAGLVNDGGDALTIYETRPGDDLHDWVQKRFDDAARAAGVDAKLVPEVTYATATATLDELFELKARVMADTDDLAKDGVEVGSVGLRDSENRALIGVDSDVDRAQAVLDARYGKDHQRAFAWEMTEESDRWNDSSPWNGGDQIVSDGGDPHGCTTGFGVHDGNGNRYVTSAGHCHAHFWWNTWIGFPVRNNSTLLGVTSGTVYDGIYSGHDIDTQKIVTTGSSRIVWTGSSTRKYIAAALGTAEGDPTCIEGSYSLTACGGVFGTDFGAGDTQYVVGISSGTTVAGDSGAPSWRESPFGPLAQGTHLGVLSGGLRVEQSINYVVFFNGVSLNTLADP
jgi:hypothetical protein